MGIIYIDRLSLFSLSRIIWFGRRYEDIFYFTSRHHSDKIAKFFKLIGLLTTIPKPAEFHFADVRDDEGQLVGMYYFNDLREMCLRISEEAFKKNIFLNVFGGIFDFQKLTIYFEKILAIELNPMLIFMNAAKWHSKTHCPPHRDSVRIIFFLEKGLWFRYLAQYANRLGMEAVSYRPMINSSYVSLLTKAIKFMVRGIKIKFNSLVKKICAPDGKHLSTLPSKGGPFVGMYYSGRPITFDLDKRGDFFWVINTDVPRERLLLYFDRFESIDVPINKEKIELLRREGIKSILLSSNDNHSSDLDSWYPGALYKNTKRRLIYMLCKTIFLEALRLKNIPFFFIGHMLYFIEKYSYWLDFFNSHNIRINVQPDDFQAARIPLISAMEKNGGINISYQCSNYDFSTITASRCCNIMFSFGPAYKWVWEKNCSAIDELIYCGYIMDYSFKAVDNNSAQLREKIVGNGAQFIVCFFDEHASDDRLCPISITDSVYAYKYLINKLLDDKTLGLIFKPKYPSTIYKKLSSITDLIKDAIDTGRCAFVGSGDFFTKELPSEAAKAADLCIGFLFSGTAVLESFLSGAPSVFIGSEEFHYKEIYTWGRGRVVFDDMDELFSKIDGYRRNPQEHQGFGDLSLWTRDRDIFKDGNAAGRIGQYVAWLLEVVGEGVNREEAIFYASRRYKDAWGEDKVISLKSRHAATNK